MKKTLIIVTTGLMTLSAATMACAHDGGKGGGKGGKGFGFMKGNPPTFAEIDVNGDGQITVEELGAVKALQFAKVDTDGNGEISAAEMSAANPNGDANRAATFIELFDADNSGGVSLAEMPSRGNDDDAQHAQMMVLRMDANGDGLISEEEYNATPMRGSKGQRNKQAPAAPATDDATTGSNT